MSFRGLLDRVVDVQTRVVATEDRRGDEELIDGPRFAGVRAARDLEQADESTAEEDRQGRRWIYFLDLVDASGARVVIDGYARILDGAEVLEVRGDPELVRRRRRPQRDHHWELIAERHT